MFQPRRSLSGTMLKTFVVETSCISICFNCYVIAQQLPRPLSYPVAMSLYQITIPHLSRLQYTCTAHPSTTPLCMCRLIYCFELRPSRKQSISGCFSLVPTVYTIYRQKLKLKLPLFDCFLLRLNQKDRINLHLT